MNELNQINVQTNKLINKILYISALNHQNKVYLPIKILINKKCGLEISYLENKNDKLLI